MRRRLLVLALAAVMVAMMASASPAKADGFFNDRLFDFNGILDAFGNGFFDFLRGLHFPDLGGLDIPDFLGGGGLGGELIDINDVDINIGG